eukprot:EG_transcript_16352
MAPAGRLLWAAAVWWAAGALDLPPCAHPRPPSPARPWPFSSSARPSGNLPVPLLRLPCKLQPPMILNASRQERVCPLAYDPRMELRRGPDGACLLRGTQAVVTPSAAFYVDEIVKAVLGFHTAAFPGLLDGSKWPPEQARHVLSMAGLRRLNNVQSLLEDVVFRGVPGDFIETGVWRGGICLVAAAVFRAYGQFPQRNVWLADSFEGLPPSTWDIDRKFHEGMDDLPMLKDNSMAAVQRSFKGYDLLNDNIKWLPGYFNETLPKAKKQWTAFAVIRLDGDLYQSVYESFVHLYPLLSRGGYVIVDDYWDWVGARMATETYMKEQRIKARVFPVYHAPGEEIRGAWFQKP